MMYIKDILALRYSTILDEKIREALIKKGFDPTDRDYLTENGCIIELLDANIMQINGVDICLWTTPKYRLAVEDSRITAVTDFEFKEL